MSYGTRTRGGERDWDDGDGGGGSPYPVLRPQGLPKALALSARIGSAVFLHGASGVGKSASVIGCGQDSVLKRQAWDQWAAGTGKVVPEPLPDLEVVHLTIPQMEAEDFVGVPFHRKVTGSDWDEDRTTAWAPAEFFRRPRPVILFLDEVTSAETRVQKVLLQVVQERKVFNVSLAPGTIVVLAGNRAEDRAHTRSVPFPLGNRCLHYSFQADSHAWSEWAVTEGLPSIFVAYAGHNPIHSFSAADPSLAQLTPRSLTAAAKAYGVATELKLSEGEVQAAIQAAVGLGEGVKIWAWVRLQDQLPSWKEISTSPETAKLPERYRLDHAYFLAGFLVDQLLAEGTPDSAFGAVATYLGRFIAEAPEAVDVVGWFSAALSRGGTKAEPGRLLKVFSAFANEARLAEISLRFMEGVANAPLPRVVNRQMPAHTGLSEFGDPSQSSSSFPDDDIPF